VSHLAEDVPAFPGKRIGDGGMHVLIIKKHVSRGKLVWMFGQMEKGNHLREPEVRLQREGMVVVIVVVVVVVVVAVVEQEEEEGWEDGLYIHALLVVIRRRCYG